METTGPYAVDVPAKRRGLILAASIATLAWTALAIEGRLSVSQSLADGSTWIEALFFFLRYFTILTNIAVASVMTATVVRRAPAPASLYMAVTIYAVVTGITYELLLRSLWSPHGMQFDTDLAMHDIVPILTLLFWLVFAPKRGMRWRDTPRLLAFPAAYFAMTLIAGALGAGYPYDFLDVAKLGYPIVLGVATVFLLAFEALGILFTGIGRSLP